MNSTLIQTDRFTLSETERSAIEHELHHYEDPRAASIEALKIVQKERGWVPDGALYAMCMTVPKANSAVKVTAFGTDAKLLDKPIKSRESRWRISSPPTHCGSRRPSVPNCSPGPASPAPGRDTR